MPRQPRAYSPLSGLPGLPTGMPMGTPPVGTPPTALCIARLSCSLPWMSTSRRSTNQRKSEAPQISALRSCSVGVGFGLGLRLGSG